MNAMDSYLENQVLTATPQKLRLLLIEGALRFAHAALAHWAEGRNEEAFEAIVRCRAIVTELFSVIDTGAFETAAQVRDLYLFLFGELTEAQMHRDAEQVRGVIRVLEEERETWRRLCEQMPDTPAPPRHFEPQEITVSHFAGESAAGAASGRGIGAAPTGFSLDA